MSQKKRARKPAARQRTADGYENLTARLGIRSPNLSSSGTYAPNFTSRNRTLLEFAYRSSWLVGAAVDAIADDMTKKGVGITSQLDPKVKNRLEAEWEALAIWEALNDILKWSRLYGGAIGVILIDGQDMSQPLRVETIGRDAFKGILPLDRWMLNLTSTEMITDLGPDLGKPLFYEVVGTAQGIPGWKIHHSRVIRMDGIGLPYQQAYTENGWGMSVIERLYDRLLAYDSASTGAAQLIHKSHLRTYSIEGLREVLGTGGEVEAELMKHLDMIRLFQSIEGMTIMDKDDAFQTHSYSFGGLSDVLEQFSQQIAGAVGIPMVRLFGQSPAGWSTGDTDLANYYDNISTLQARRLRRQVRRLFDILHRSLSGTPLPEDFTFEFTPLWQMKETDRAAVAMSIVEALGKAVDSDLLPLHVARSALRDAAKVTGIGANISDEDIEDAKDIDPPTSGDFHTPDLDATGKALRDPAA